MLVRSDILMGRTAAGRCVPAFNIYNLETAQAALEASRRTSRDVILAFGASYLDNAEFEVVASMVREMTRTHPAGVALHLDHCQSLELLERAAQAGFTSLMYDGSRLPLAENIAMTRLARDIADAHHCALEGELGGLNDENGKDSGDDIRFTDPEDARRFVCETRVDCLAVSVGNAHGFYRGEPRLDLDRIARIRDAAGVPLVLHGCSGIPRETLREAAALGIRKINVNTEVALAATRRAGELLAENPQMRLNALMLALREEMAHVMEDYFIE